MRRWLGALVRPVVTTGLTCLAALSAWPATLHAQDVACDSPDRIEVRRLDFQGNKALSDDELSARVLTTPSSATKRFLRVIGTPRCYPSVGLAPDVRALLQFYKNNGFYDTQVDTIVRPAGPKAVSVTFRINEGQPILVDTMSVTGLDSIPQKNDVLNNLLLRAGGRFSLLWEFTDMDSIVARLRNAGYPHAAVYPATTVRLLQHEATAAFDVEPGPRARFGVIDVKRVGVENRPPEIDSAVVLHLLGFKSGDWYSDNAVLNAQRNLYQLGAYRNVSIIPDTTYQHGDTLADVLVNVREDYMRQLEMDEGWATLDCGRVNADYTDKNFLNEARQLEVTGRVSKLGWGSPTDWAFTRENLCYHHYLENDSIASSTVNYYLGATLREPSLFGSHWVPAYSLYSERRGEYEAYLRRTDIGGEASATRTIGFGMPLRVAYNLELGQTLAQPAILCLAFDRCSKPQQDEVQRRQRLAIVSAALQRTRTDNLVNPTRGSSLAGELRVSEPWIGSDTALRFIKGTFDGSFYYPISPGTVLATRLRLGAIGGGNLPPQQERLYAGGATSVRGFQQNELGSVAYVLDSASVDVVKLNDSTYVYTAKPGARSQRVVPVGGNQLVVANVELRLRDPFFPNLLQYVLFTDAGDVWTRQSGASNLGFTHLLVTPGFGIRIFSPVGPIDINAGYNPYGNPPAQAYYPVSSGNAPLICVSPGAPVVTMKAGGILNQDPTNCPAAFVQPTSSNFFKRLVLTISIGTGS